MIFRNPFNNDKQCLEPHIQGTPFSLAVSCLSTTPGAYADPGCTLFDTDMWIKRLMTIKVESSNVPVPLDMFSKVKRLRSTLETFNADTSEKPGWTARK